MTLGQVSWRSLLGSLVPTTWCLAIVVCTATHMHGGPYAYASHYALSGIRKLGACTSLASPNASHYAARRTPPPSKINRKRQYIHVIIACVTVRWPCGCLIRTTCHVYGLWISAGAPRPAGGRGVFDVSRIRITHTSFSPQSFARGTVQWPARRVPYVPRLTFTDYVSRPRAPPSLPPTRMILARRRTRCSSSRRR